MGGPRSIEQVTVRVLGAVAVEGPAGTVPVRGRQPAAVTAFLAESQRPATRDELAELLWGEQLSSHWQSAVRGVMSKVRSTFVAAGFEPTAIRSDDAVVSIDLPTVQTDLELIEHLLDGHSATTADLAAAKQALGRPFLPHDDSTWGRRVRDRIGRTQCRVGHRLVRALRDEGHLETAITELRELVHTDPLDEAAHHLLIETLLAVDRRTEASEALETLTTTLAFELGVTPAPATVELLGVPGPAIATAVPRTPDRQASTVLHAHTDEPFVGRRRELATFEEAWGDVVRHGRPGLVIIEGPAGIGKTRLVDRFQRQHAGEIGHLLWGRNRQARDHSFGALAEAVRRLIDDRPDLVSRLGERAGGLWPLLGGAAPGGGEQEESAVRLDLIGALRSVLQELGDAPVLWFVDDVHWASPDTISVVESVVDGLSVPLLVVAAARAVPGELGARLGALQRVLPTTPLHLGALSVDDVAELLHDPVAADSLQARTGGLPFYLSEVARQARTSAGGLDLNDIPATITDWVSRRIQALPTEQGACLRLASVVGEEIDVDVLARCSSLDAAAHAAAVDGLVTSGLLDCDPRTGALQFSHAITRDVVYDSIGAATRMELHRQIAEAIAAQHRALHSEPNHAVLARHYGRAGVGTAELAWMHSMRAARSSMRVGAWSTAAGLYLRATELAPTLRQRLQAKVGAGRAQVAGGTLDAARTQLYEAVEIAEEHGLPTIQAAATSALVGRAGRGAVEGMDDREQIRLLRSALSALHHHRDELGPRGLELWADLERELGFVLLLNGERSERDELLHRSLSRARAIEPARPRAVARALLGRRYAELDPRRLHSRIDDAREVLSIPARNVGSEVRLAAHCYLYEDLLRLRDWDEAEHTLVQAERLAERYPHSYWTWAVRTWRALSLLQAGQDDAAESAAFGAAGMRPGIVEAEACLAVNLTNIRLEQGRASEMIPTLAAAASAHPEIPTYRAVHALCAAESGDHDAARDIVAAFDAQGFETLPEDPNRFLGLAVLAHAAATVGDRSACARLRGLLEPYGEQWVVLQCYGGGGATWGPTTHALARLARTLGHHDEAEGLFDRAHAHAAASPLTLARIDRDRRAP